METPKVLSLEDVRARVQSRRAQGVDISKMKTFEHSGLGGTVLYGALPSFALARYENIAQFYPLDHANPQLRGLKCSTAELDELNREKCLLRYGVRLNDGRPLDEETIEWLISDQHSGSDNRELALAVLRETYNETNANNTDADAIDKIAGFTRWDAAFHDLLVKSGWVAHWVEYVTSSDTSTPEAKEAAHKLAKVEEAAPEWAKTMQAGELIKALNAADPEPN